MVHVVKPIKITTGRHVRKIS